MSNETCQTCKHFHIDNELGTCRNKSPETTGWPQVTPTDSCGEWERRVEPMTDENIKMMEELLKKCNNNDGPPNSLLDVELR